TGTGRLHHAGCRERSLSRACHQYRCLGGGRSIRSSYERVNSRAQRCADQHGTIPLQEDPVYKNVVAMMRRLSPNGTFVRAGILACAWAMVSSTSCLAESKVPIIKFAGGEKVKLEVAVSREEVSRGLMYRTSMPEDNGMVFLFRPATPANFWMYHTLIPLDMLFINEGKIVKLFEQVPPCKSEKPDDCARYPEGPGIVVSEVVELNAGGSKLHGVQWGASVN